jgi:CheY-like chemotaxis protein
MNSTKSVILVVEDDPLILIHSRMALEDAGYEVVSAASGEAALCEVARRDDLDALFTDIELSGAVDGVSVAEAMRLANPDASIVVTSGKQAPGNDDLPDGGRFMAKPYTAAQMRRALADC